MIAGVTLIKYLGNIDNGYRNGISQNILDGNEGVDLLIHRKIFFIFTNTFLCGKKITGRIHFLMKYIHAADTFLNIVIFLLIEKFTGRTLLSIENICIPNAFFNSTPEYR